MLGADDAERPVPRARLLQDGGLPPRLDPGGHRRDPEARHGEQLPGRRAPRTPSLFTDAFLAHYDVVVFLSTTGDVLNDTQQAAFERFIRAGGGYVGIHAAADTEYTWPWYGKLVGAYFRNHPAGTPTATVVVEDTDHHSTHGPAGPAGRASDEWYNYQSPDRPGGQRRRHRLQPARTAGVHVLLTMDESTYAEDDGNTDG